MAILVSFADFKASFSVDCCSVETLKGYKTSKTRGEKARAVAIQFLESP